MEELICNVCSEECFPEKFDANLAIQQNDNN